MSEKEELARFEMSTQELGHALRLYLEARHGDEIDGSYTFSVEWRFDGRSGPSETSPTATVIFYKAVSEQ